MRQTDLPWDDKKRAMLMKLAKDKNGRSFPSWGQIAAMLGFDSKRDYYRVANMYRCLKIKGWRGKK